MKLKFPKKIIIGSTEFDIKYDKKRNGGEFSYPHGKERAFVIIGMRDYSVNPLRTLEIIIHEFKEIIQEEQNVRLGRMSDDGTFEFHYKHAEHTDLCARLTRVLNEFIK